MLFNQILNPRLVSPLVRLFGMKTGQNPAPTLAPEVQPTLDTNQQDDASVFFLRRSRLVGCFFNVAAVVGQQCEWQVRNPVNSGVLLILHGLMVESGTATLYGTRITSADYGTIITAGGQRDTRWLPSSSRAAIVSAQTSAVPLVYSMGRISAAFTDELELGVTLAPGTSFNALSVAANTATNVSIWWEERPVAAEELQTG